MQDAVRLKSFELFARDIGSVDISLLHALSISVGWPHRPKDWEFLLSVGEGIVAVDGIGRVFGSAMWFPHGDDFATIGLVITTPRTQAQGNGRWLMDQVLARCAGRDLALNSTRAAYILYHSLGFATEGQVHMHQGVMPPVTAARLVLKGEIEALTPDALADIAALDHAAFEADRMAHLKGLAETASIRVLRRGGAIVGYSMCRPFGRGHVIGPIVASSDNDAIHLAAVHLDGLGGQFVRVDTRSDGPFGDFLRRNGLTVAETVTTMSKGRRILIERPGEPIVFGLAGHALG
ncbi:GNAT family N-acetyltransferase [Fulvimarina sp. MAC3]|uniref:GNAT family N-acetyltransferase n=1 Tax=Fulvimarina sp. MAC3 TaxID=3148887 RepID=UPI0031FDE1A6